MFWKCVNYGCKFWILFEPHTCHIMGKERSYTCFYYHFPLWNHLSLFHFILIRFGIRRNLPKQYKMTKPRYQPILKDMIPSVDLPLGSDGTDTCLATARIIAGELNGVVGPAKTFSPVQMWDVSLPHVGSEIDIPFPAGHNCIVFVRRGRVQILSGENGSGTVSNLGPQDVAVMDDANHDDNDDGSARLLRLRVQESDSSVLIMGGEPLNEPIAAQGPFVMNTPQEIQEAIFDYRSGRF